MNKFNDKVPRLGGGAPIQRDRRRELMAYGGGYPKEDGRSVHKRESQLGRMWDAYFSTRPGSEEALRLVERLRREHASISGG